MSYLAPRKNLKTLMRFDAFFYILHKASGVVGRERTGTAFPHKKLSFHKRNFERYLFVISYFPLLLCYKIWCTSNHPKTEL